MPLRQGHSATILHPPSRGVTMPNMTASQIIRELLSRGLTQTEIEQRCECSQPHVSRLAAGLRGRNPRPVLDQRLRAFLQKIRQRDGVKKQVPQRCASN